MKKKARLLCTHQYPSGRPALSVFATSTPKLPANSQGRGISGVCHLCVQHGCSDQARMQVAPFLSIPASLPANKIISQQPLQRLREYYSDHGSFSSLEKSYDQSRQHIKKQRHYFANNGPSSQSHGFSSGHVWT